ncbi:MAG: hypothetical protein CMH63_01610 [Nanoarchaeota archaeon]|jgi:hypothetical protein|nr:hypothetical protein [Nanoarchaeota archaeon]|tara:strand:+ start:7450 stop:7659 length:210 start_codon:yes stop_codon:yes gene_type:complete
MVEIILSPKDREIEIAVTKDSTLLERNTCKLQTAETKLRQLSREHENVNYIYKKLPKRLLKLIENLQGE